MKEIKNTKIVETAITKITYQSDDGNCTSEDREKVELYEAHQKSNLMPIGNFYLPENSNSYFVFEINSRDDLLVYKDTHKDANICFDGFREADVPKKIKGYFVSHYEDDDWPYHHIVEPFDKFVKNLKESIEESRKTLKQQEEALVILEKYKNETTE